MCSVFNLAYRNRPLFICGISSKLIVKGTKISLQILIETHASFNRDYILHFYYVTIQSVNTTICPTLRLCFGPELKRMEFRVSLMASSFVDCLIVTFKINKRFRGFPWFEETLTTERGTPESMLLLNKTKRF